MSDLEAERVTAEPIEARSTELLATRPPEPMPLVPATMDDLWRIAKRVAGTSFVPAAMRNKPESVLACILSGREMGLEPMAALRHLYEVHGRIGCSAELMRAAFRAAGHSLKVVESTAEVCTLQGTRANGGDSDEVTWKLADAEQAGLFKQGGAWTTYPRQMLLARATAELVRRLAPEVLLGGVSYTAEELGGEPHPEDLG